MITRALSRTSRVKLSLFRHYTRKDPRTSIHVRHVPQKPTSCTSHSHHAPALGCTTRLLTFFHYRLLIKPVQRFKLLSGSLLFGPVSNHLKSVPKVFGPPSLNFNLRFIKFNLHFIVSVIKSHNGPWSDHRCSPLVKDSSFPIIIQTEGSPFNIGVTLDKTNYNIWS